LVDAHQMKVQMFRYTQAWDLHTALDFQIWKVLVGTFLG